MEKTGDPWPDVGGQVKISTPDLHCQAIWSPWSAQGDPAPHKIIKSVNISMGKEMATHSSIRAWKIPWIEEPGRLQSMGLQRVGHNCAHKEVLFLLWATTFFNSK